MPPPHVPDLTFRKAAEADLPAIVALLADDALGGSREQPGLPLPPEYAAGFRAMTAQGGIVLLADQEGAIVGCLQLDILHGVSQRGLVRAQVEGVRVASHCRGQGIGAALMQEAVRRAEALGAGSMQLTTNAARHDAQRFYARLGFVQSHVGFKRDIRPRRIPGGLKGKITIPDDFDEWPDGFIELMEGRHE